MLWPHEKLSRDRSQVGTLVPLLGLPATRFKGGERRNHLESWSNLVSATFGWPWAVEAAKTASPSGPGMDGFRTSKMRKLSLISRQRLPTHWSHGKRVPLGRESRTRKTSCLRSEHCILVFCKPQNKVKAKEQIRSWHELELEKEK